ncbi:hypothetical protein CHARACLAT_017037 [Characodon lateralis]|uniref:Uncharacterized protein n=1 Tax=Characodon lateralis TaxID=208331 RepID=A0ABU7D1D8_9TELE|nr:hypothetical protein [Characodon lateralis]
MERILTILRRIQQRASDNLLNREGLLLQPKGLEARWGERLRVGGDIGGEGKRRAEGALMTERATGETDGGLSEHDENFSVQDRPI